MSRPIEVWLLTISILMMSEGQQQQQVSITPEQHRELTSAVASHFQEHLTIDFLNSEAKKAARRLYVPAYGTETMAQLLFAIASLRLRSDVLEIGSGFTTPFLLAALHGNHSRGTADKPNRVLITVDDMSHAEHSTVHTNIRAVRGSLATDAPSDAFVLYGKGWKGIREQVRSTDSEIGKALRKHAAAGGRKEGFQGFGVIWDDATSGHALGILEDLWPLLESDGTGLFLSHWSGIYWEPHSERQTSLLSTGLSKPDIQPLT